MKQRTNTLAEGQPNKKNQILYVYFFLIGSQAQGADHKTAAIATVCQRH